MVAYPASDSAEALVDEWRSLAAVPVRRECAVLRGDDRTHFRRLKTQDETGKFGVEITTTKAPDERKLVDALSTGDGTYELFEQLFDGYEVFVPWSTNVGTIEAPGCPLDGKQRNSIDTLTASMKSHVASYEGLPPADPELARLANELLAAGQLAKKLRMFIQVSVS